MTFELRTFRPFMIVMGIVMLCIQDADGWPTVWTLIGLGLILLALALGGGDDEGDYWGAR